MNALFHPYAWSFPLNFFFMTEMYIRGDDRDLTREFENVNFTYTTPSLSLRQENLTIIASFLNTCKLTLKLNIEKLTIWLYFLSLREILSKILI